MYHYCQIPFMKLRKDRFNYTIFVNMQTRYVWFFFLLSRYGNSFFFNCCENPYMKREGLNYLWVPCVSWGFYVEKMTSVPNYFQRGESAFYVVPSEKIMFCFFIYLRDSCHLLVHSLNAHNDPILEPNLGAQSKPPTWVAGTQTLEPSQLLPKVHRSRKLELEKRVRLWTQALWYGTRGSKMAPYQLGQTPTPR